jgi:hypothetical protein
MPNPGFPLNCPKCGKPLVYVRTDGDTHFYRCLATRLGHLAA